MAQDQTTAADTARMSAYCTYCPKMCRFSCPAADAEGRETVTPWGMMRLWELVRTQAVVPSPDVAEVFYHCTGCRRCQTWCRHGNDVPMALWEARAAMARAGVTPPAIAEVVERFAAHGTRFEDPPKPLLPTDLAEVFDVQSPVGFFADCHTRQHRPAMVLWAGRLLARLEGQKVRLLSEGRQAGQGRCCGFALLSAGQPEAFDAHQRAMDAEMQGLERVITDCASFAATRRAGTSWPPNRRDAAGPDPGTPAVEHLVAYLARRVSEHPPARRVDAQGLLLHDSCVTGRQLGLFQAVRELVKALCEEPIQEMSFAREQAACCGAMGLYDHMAPEDSAEAARLVTEQMRLEEGRGLICAQSACQQALSRADDDAMVWDILALACRAYEVDGP